MDWGKFSQNSRWLWVHMVQNSCLTRGEILLVGLRFLAWFPASSGKLVPPHFCQKIEFLAKIFTISHFFNDHDGCIFFPDHLESIWAHFDPNQLDPPKSWLSLSFFWVEAMHHHLIGESCLVIIESISLMHHDI